jgi:hypothetical protein
MSAVLKDDDVSAEFTFQSTRMTIEDAVMLFFMGNYSEVQWDQMAKAVNQLMDTNIRKKFGHIIPCSKTLQRQYGPIMRCTNISGRNLLALLPSACCWMNVIHHTSSSL